MVYREEKKIEGREREKKNRGKHLKGDDKEKRIEKKKLNIN